MIKRVRDLRVSFQGYPIRMPQMTPYLGKKKKEKEKKGTKQCRFKLKQGSSFEPCEPVTVHRTGQSNWGLDGSMLFSHGTVLHLKWTVDVNGSRVSWSNSTVRFGFKFHDL